MNRSFFRRGACVLLFLFFALIISHTISLSQEVSDEALKEKYAAILGQYEMHMGEQATILKFTIEEGALWATPEGGRAIMLEPEGENPFEFKGEDSVTGTIEIKFSKDDQGEYSVCQVLIRDMDMEMTGHKIKK